MFTGLFLATIAVFGILSTMAIAGKPQEQKALIYDVDDNGNAIYR